jgi:hypothetical protein
MLSFVLLVGVKNSNAADALAMLSKAMQVRPLNVVPNTAGLVCAEAP